VRHLVNADESERAKQYHNFACQVSDGYGMINGAPNRMVEISRTRNLASIPLQDGDLGLEWIDFALHPAHKVPTHHFRMVHSQTREELGTINLRVSSSPHIELYAGHVGYSVKTDHRGNRYASRAVRLLIPIARQVGLNPLWITCGSGERGFATDM